MQILDDDEEEEEAGDGDDDIRVLASSLGRRAYGGRAGGGSLAGAEEGSGEGAGCCCVGRGLGLLRGSRWEHGVGWARARAAGVRLAEQREPPSFPASAGHAGLCPPACPPTRVCCGAAGMMPAAGSALEADLEGGGGPGRRVRRNRRRGANVDRDLEVLGGWVASPNSFFAQRRVPSLQGILSPSARHCP